MTTVRVAEPDGGTRTFLRATLRPTVGPALIVVCQITGGPLHVYAGSEWTACHITHDDQKDAQ